MQNRNFKKIKFWILIHLTACIISIDIFSKLWIVNNIKIYETHKICTILNLFHVHNYGAAFSFLSTQTGWQRWFLCIISSFIILTLIKKSIQSRKIKIFYYLIISGAIGNLIDRIFYGFVVDFIDFHLNNWHFFTFNIADASIFIGLCIMIKNFNQKI